MIKNIFGLTIRANTNIWTGIRKHEYEYKYLSHTELSLQSLQFQELVKMTVGGGAWRRPRMKVYDTNQEFGGNYYQVSRCALQLVLSLWPATSRN